LKTINNLISFLIILSLFTLTGCDNLPVKKVKQKIQSTKNIIVGKSESKKQKRVFENNKDYVFGVDFSHYQGLIDWDKLKYFDNKKEISFVVVRATMGSRKKDNYFTHNWRSAAKSEIIRGAYHYYRPNENSKKQAQNFIKRVKLKKGDLPPILDIERVSRTQSLRSLQIGLKNLLNIIEKHYGVKPIIYSGDKFHQTFLNTSEFKDYPLWIANYNWIKHPKTKQWSFWQFSEKGKVKGVSEYVDLNVFKGTKQDLKQILIR